MQITKNEQYANIKQYVLVVLHTIKYWNSPTNFEYTFDNPTEWALPVPSLTSVNNNNAGTKVYAGIDKTAININSINNYNPLTILSKVATRPFILSATNIVGAKLINKDYKDNTIQGFSFDNLGANNIVNVRFYTNLTLTAYYNVAINLPVANTRYKINFNPFVNGPYGSLGTAQNIGGQLYNTAQATVTQVGSPTGTFITAMSVNTSGTITTGVIPIYGESVNNATQLVGQKLSIVLCCLKEFIEELEREYDELECSGDITGKVLKKQTLSINFTVQKNIELLVALGLGNDIIEKLINITGNKEVLNISTGTNVTAPLSGSVTASNLSFVTIDTSNQCVTLQRDYINNTSATLDGNFYYVDSTNNQLILPLSVATNVSVNAYPITSQLVKAIDYYTNNNPIQCVLEVKRQSVSGVQISGGLYTLELSAGTSSAEDTGDTMEFANTVLLTGRNQAIKYTY